MKFIYGGNGYEQEDEEDHRSLDSIDVLFRHGIHDADDAADRACDGGCVQ